MGVSFVSSYFEKSQTYFLGSLLFYTVSAYVCVCVHAYVQSCVCVHVSSCVRVFVRVSVSASQITSNSDVCCTACSGLHQRIHQRSP